MLTVHRRVLTAAAPGVLALVALAAPAHASAAPAPSAAAPHECAAIDSYSPNAHEEHTVALVDGRAFAGEWDAKLHTIVWQDLSDNPGFPAHACDITISEQGDKAFVKTVTRDGAVHETTCNTAGKDVKCDKPWTQLRPPTAHHGS
ncbi:hypothetical protein [Streptomyces sp. CC224B]|uniref:hypothetical protein n=1 Tax=Streptomyces sp. CC224B TaxID=3044571 RepID=UPI0024A96B52|nr:hypothetical protein [Streptomyces sp. CC224B]